MASPTVGHTGDTHSPELAASLLRLRIEPPRGLFNLRLGEVWAYRELLYFLVWRDLKVRYKQTIIGVVWVIIQPLLSMGVFTIFFGRLAKLPSDGLPYPVFYLAALVPWSYFATALQSGTNVVVENQRLITKVYFPRVLLPVSSVAAGLIDFSIVFAMLLLITLKFGIVPGVRVLLLPLFLLLAVATALGAALWLSALNAMYRDVRYVTPFLVQIWMLASPVVYPSSLVPAKWRWLYGLNPISGVIEGFRWALTGHGQPSAPLLLASAVMVLTVLLGGMFFFQRMEGAVADLV
jgi:lipopolysaccharide transport system permease protein